MQEKINRMHIDHNKGTDETSQFVSIFNDLWNTGPCKIGIPLFEQARGNFDEIVNISKIILLLWNILISTQFLLLVTFVYLLV